MRRCHYIKPNQGNELPHDAIWLDTETHPESIDEDTERHVLEFGWAAHRRTWKADTWTDPDWFRFTDIDSLWEWLESKLHGKTRLYIFAHNWAFDFPVLNGFTELVERGWTLTGSVIQSPPVILRYRRAPYTLQFVDTLNIWRMPLKKLGKSLSLPKLDMPNVKAPRADWDRYARRDVEIIMEACLKWWVFLRTNDLGGFASTLAAQAFRTYRHRFMSHQILVDDNSDALSLARHALHGGRTECFFIGNVKERIYKLDINSQYPAVMQCEPMPVKLIGHYRRVFLDEVTEWVSKYCVVAKCRIKTNTPVYPVVWESKLTFPTGDFVTYLSTPELEHAIKHNHLVQVDEAAVYEKAVIFKDFVDWMNAFKVKARMEGRDVDAHSAKYLMASLYGKFGQKGLIYEKDYETSDLSPRVWLELDATTGEVYHHRQYGGIVETLVEETESRESHPAIAAHVTAYARMMLWGLMQQAGKDNVYYCDTDSLWCNRAGYDKLSGWLDFYKLGHLKVEGVHDDVVIYGPKDYSLDGKETIKGIKAKARKMSEAVYEQEKFTTLIGLLRVGDLSAPRVTTITKHLKRQYTKGIVSTSGRVEPLIFAPESAP